MISLIVALLAGSAFVQPQAVQATLQSCALENGRTVCRYTLPDIVIGSAPVSEVVGADQDAPLPQPLSRTAAPAIPTASVIATSAPAPVVLAPAVSIVDPDPMRPIDSRVLTEREAPRASECADAGWTSSCPPDDRPPSPIIADFYRVDKQAETSAAVDD